MVVKQNHHLISQAYILQIAGTKLASTQPYEDLFVEFLKYNQTNLRFEILLPESPH